MTSALAGQAVVSAAMKATLAVVLLAVVAVACSSDGGGDEQRPLRIDGPAEIDPEFVEERNDTRSDSGG